ncbi:hypothetical protein [Sorangium sp. So ce124]|uniref:hypothetical protein n=1 Tax=Sorangium sp. So ce124 TaxID=3133280 RepID=UPI003F5DDA94
MTRARRPRAEGEGALAGAAAAPRLAAPRLAAGDALYYASYRGEVAGEPSR